MRRVCSSLFLLAMCTCETMWAEDLSPWYPPALGIETKAAYLFQTYSSVASSHGSFSRQADDQLLTLSAASAYDVWAIEMDGMLAQTHAHGFMVDHLGLTGRYQWLNDTLGDDVSLVSGIVLSKPFKRALNDIGCFHHGHFEGELSLSLGKEFICKDRWISRGWAVVGLGVADIGSPWLLGDFAWEQRWYDVHCTRFFMHSLCGFGQNSLHSAKHFHGYGSIRHRSIDIGLGYNYRFDNGAIIEFDYAYRVLARNFPKNTSLCRFILSYPLGL